MKTEDNHEEICKMLRVNASTVFGFFYACECLGWVDFLFDRQIWFWDSTYLPLDITAIYVPEDEEWLVSPPSNYLEIIEAHFNRARQEYIKYVDNVIAYNGYEWAERWAAEEKRQAEGQRGEDYMQEWIGERIETVDKIT